MRKSKNNRAFSEEGFIAFIFWSLIIGLIGCGVGRSTLKDEMQKLKGEAVTKSYAEWATKPETGEVSFRWKENSK